MNSRTRRNKARRVADAAVLETSRAGAETMRTHIAQVQRIVAAGFSYNRETRRFMRDGKPLVYLNGEPVL